MNFLPKSLAAACVLTLAALAAPAQAFIVTLTTTGTAGGVDRINAFGLGGPTWPQDGEPFYDIPFTQTISIETAGLRPLIQNSAETTMENASEEVKASGSMTMNGKTYSWVLVKQYYSYARLTLARYVSLGQVGLGFDRVGAHIWGDNYIDNGTVINAETLIESPSTPFVDHVNFAQGGVFDGTAPGIVSKMRFLISYDSWLATWAHSDNAVTRLTWTVSGVPEPGTAAMLIVGLGLVGASLRRQSA